MNKFHRNADTVTTLTLLSHLSSPTPFTPFTPFTLWSFLFPMAKFLRRLLGYFRCDPGDKGYFGHLPWSSEHLMYGEEKRREKQHAVCAVSRGVCCVLYAVCCIWYYMLIQGLLSFFLPSSARYIMVARRAILVLLNSGTNTRRYLVYW
jgi:hypothetical protein